MRDKNNKEEGKMTVEEAGRKGGETVKRKYGPEFYSEIGHKGGQRVKELIEEGKEEEQSGRNR
jgi:general stress protein YciG